MANYSNADSVSLCSADFHHHDLSDDPNRQVVVVEALCLVAGVQDNEHVKEAAEALQLDIVSSATGEEYRGDANVAFVMDTFSGTDYNYLNAAGRRIFGPTVIIESAASRKLPIRSKIQPVYCQSMKGIVCALTGFRVRKDMLEAVDKIHFMAGSVRKSWGKQITHLIAKTTQSDKYRLAISMGVPAMKLEWVDYCWERRNTVNSASNTKELEKQFKLEAFYDLRLSFLGIPDEEVTDMIKNTERNGGHVIPLGPSTTHLIVERDIKDVPTLPSNKIHVVTTEWFWVSVQLEVCANESLYPVSSNVPPRKRPISSPDSENRHSRRSHAYKKRSISDRSLDAGFDASSDVDGTLPDHMFSTEDIDALIQSPQKQTSKRRQCCVELLQTERNYVDILKIMITYKEGLEGEEAKEGDELMLTKAEMQLIFGKVGPIYALHEEICNDLVNNISHWSEDREIGKVWVDVADRLERCYPPFMNNYDQAKATLVAADKNRPKLHAFLKARQSRPESQRQSLIELLIRPIQRLPSVTLLLQEVLKRTDKSHPDHANLQKALAAIKRVLAHINEDKRKTEDRMKIFEIFNGIESCPVELISAQRQFLSRLDVQDLSGGFAKQKGQVLTLYLFNDAVEVTKKRTHRVSEEVGDSPTPLTPSLDRGGTMSKFNLSRHRPAHKTHKHIKLLSLTSIRRVSDVRGYDTECPFALTVREHTSEDTWALQAIGVTESVKKQFLHILCQQVVVMCGPSRSVGPFTHEAPCADGVDAHVPMTPTQHIIDEQFKKALKHQKGNSRLTRRLSFVGQTPTANRLSRAVSSMTLRMHGTLSRMSRSNLRLTNINELPSPSVAEHNNMDAPPMPPKRLQRDSRRKADGRIIQSSAVQLPSTAPPTAI